MGLCLGVTKIMKQTNNMDLYQIFTVHGSYISIELI